MDRQGYKKVISFLILWLIFACSMTVGAGIIAKIEVQTRHAQMAEMIVMHPEQKQELTESFDYYGSEMNTYFFRFWLFLMVTSILSFGLCYFARRRKDRKEKCEISRDLKMLSEQLEQFKKGNYQLITKANYTGLSEEWEKIEDDLRELSYYFISLKEQLSNEENSTKTLITDISHQLKTPLSSLRLSHELAQETELTDEERQEFLQQEEQEIHKLEILLEELVNVSRLENHMIQIEPEQSGIKKTIMEAVNQVVMKAHSKDIRLQVDIAEDVNVCHDPKWTAEAISNILDNAIKYSDTGSCIAIRVQKLPNLLLLEIEDEGIGIPPEELHKIFQRFYRGKAASSKVKEGAGVGLYLTRRILEEQGGTIAAKRKPQNGTIFRITLPIELGTLTKL